MECFVVIFYSIYKISDFDIRLKLFFYLTYKSLLRSFTSFNFSTWKFPLTFEVTISACSSKNFIIIAYYSSYDSNYFQDSLLLLFEKLILLHSYLV